MTIEGLRGRAERLWRQRGVRWLVLGAVAVFGSWFAIDYFSLSGPMTVQQYLHDSSASSMAPAGYSVEGAPIACGKVQILLDPSIDDVAEAYPGIVIVNPKRFDKLPKVVRLYAFGHECGHQLHGVSEEMADCYAVSRGQAQGWLDEAGVEAICAFWKPYAGDNKHLPGPERCELMKRCFAMARKAG